MKLYIGVENEITSFHRGELYDFNQQFSRFKRGHINAAVGARDETGFIDPEGNAFYMDGSVLELCTVPIALTRGFATRLARAVAIGRNRIVTHDPDIEFTGYSMHWNITKTCYTSYEFFKRFAAVPIHLFGLTPLSKGFEIRHAPRADFISHELLTDSIKDYHQVQAAALLFGAAICAAQQKEFSTPFTLAGEFDSGNSRGLLKRGRETELVFRVGNTFKTLTAQEYMELFHRWLLPEIDALANQEEKKNLQRFISGSKALEMDRADFYDKLDQNSKYSNGKYFPFAKGNWSTVLQRRSEPIPLEGRLLGGFLYSRQNEITDFEWGRVNFKDDFPYRLIKAPDADPTSNLFSIAAYELGMTADSLELPATQVERLPVAEADASVPEIPSSIPEQNELIATAVRPSQVADSPSRSLSDIIRGFFSGLLPDYSR